MGERDRRVPDCGNEDKIPKIVFAIDQGGGKSSNSILENIAPTLATTHYGEPVVVYERIRNDGD